MPGRSDNPSGEESSWICFIMGLSNLHRRGVSVFFAITGPKAAYVITGFLGKLLYKLLDPIRVRSESQCRVALGEHVKSETIPEIAKKSFIQRCWNLTDLMLAEYRISGRSYKRYGGALAEEHLSRILATRQKEKPVLLLTGYYGPFDLLPIFLGYNGVKATVVYKTHENQAFDRYRLKIRSRSGCEMVPVEKAANRFGEVLEQKGTVAIVADHHTEQKGVPVKFLGVETLANRSVGLLACHYGADIVVAGIRRLKKPFRFELIVKDVFEPSDWEQEADPVEYVTKRYTQRFRKDDSRRPYSVPVGICPMGRRFR